VAFDLKSLKTTSSVSPPRLLVHGPQGMGKTSLSAEFPNPIIIQPEDGTPKDMAITTFGEINNFDQVMDAIKTLYTDEHQFKTLIIDTMDRLEPMVWDKTCENNKWKSIEDPGYGKGYVAADELWRKLITGCNMLRQKHGMTIIYIAHSNIERFDDPTSAPYNRYDIRLHKRASAMLQDEVDAILFINQDLTVKATDVGFKKEVRRAEGGGVRWINCAPNPAFTAKNRFGMPDRLLFEPGEGYAQLQPFMPAHQPQPAKASKASAKQKEAA
jgi:hypothetical protein